MTTVYFHKGLKNISEHISEFKMRRKRWSGGFLLYAYGVMNPDRARREKTEVIDISTDGMYMWSLYGISTRLGIEKCNDNRLIIIGIDEV